jgi:hypothetical protein
MNKAYCWLPAPPNVGHRKSQVHGAAAGFAGSAAQQPLSGVRS